MKYRLQFRGVNASKIIAKYEGYLPELLQSEEVAALIKLIQGETSINAEIRQKLEKHHIIKKADGQYFSSIPVLTVQYSQLIEGKIQDLAVKLAQQCAEVIPQIAQKIGAYWQTIGHVFLGQLVIGSMWYKLWQDISSEKDAPTATLIADPALTHMFYQGVYPLTSEDAISFCQTALFGNPDRIHNILYSKAVIPTLQSINERYEIIPVDNALPLIAPLKMYKTRSGENGMPVQYIDLPRIDLKLTQSVRSELKQLCTCFYQISDQLDEISHTCFAERPQVFKMVDFHDFRQLVYLVFSYVVVKHWLENNHLPPIVPIKGANKKDTKISIDLKL